MKQEKSKNRRQFIKEVAVLGAMASTPKLSGAEDLGRNYVDNAGMDFTFLFQGDSITDGNRTRNNDWNHIMGHGYQYIIASKLWYDFPGKGFHFLNRGISGNKVPDLTARWQKDTIELKPNLISILIGINDSAAFINGNKDFTTANYEKEYRSLLQQTKQQLPNVEFVLCEPFILPVGKVKDKWEDYSREVNNRSEIVKQLSTEYGATFVGFQAAFKKALTKAPAEYWIWDGIHPMPAGHELMAREWIQQVRKKLKFVK